MFRKFVWLFIVLPVGVLLVSLAVANRHTVRLILDPFAPDHPVLTLEAPLFLFLFGAVIGGLLLGGAATWLGQGSWRRTARRRSQEAAEWRREADKLTRQLETASQSQLPQATPAD